MERPTTSNRIWLILSVALFVGVTIVSVAAMSLTAFAAALVALCAVVCLAFRRLRRQAAVGMILALLAGVVLVFVQLMTASGAIGGLDYGALFSFVVVAAFPMIAALNELRRPTKRGTADLAL